MKKKLSNSEEPVPLSNADMVRRISELAFGKANGSVRLAFLNAEQQELIEELDLSMVSEVKRCANGEVEVRLLNRIELLELLAVLLKPEVSEGSRAESFFSAMDKAAARLSDGEDEV